MLSLLPRQLVVESLDRLLKELHLHLILVLDLTVLHDNLLVVVLDVPLQLVQHAHLQLLIVVDVLSHPADSVFERSDDAVIFADL